MPYDFTSLLPADFEDLARDLVGAALGVRFEAFGPGPDGGMDGRHTMTDGDIILQAKHYAGSTFAQLSSTMRNERAAIDRLAPARYILATSRDLSPPNKATLAAIIGTALLSQADILGRGDLNKLLRDHPDIERAHLKLWLSSTTVLQTILQTIIHSGSHAFTASSEAEIAAKVKVYAQNPSLVQAREVLDGRHVLIISGPPGVGKTTLAEILTFAYLREGWELVALRSLEDGFERIDDSKQQVFFFDDFLGTIALDQRALSAKDSELARFMNRVRNSPNARFVLTTRSYILNEARQSSERLADRRVELSTYVLDLSAYTRAIRARILYNHLAIGGVPHEHVLALLESGRLPEIIDHPNYNPRVIEWMTDVVRIDDLAATDYPDVFVEALNNPAQLWDKAFRRHITPAGRHLLIALFFSGRFACDIELLRAMFESLHARLCADLGISRDPKDFEQSLRHVEGGFVSIEDGEVDFINPSVRDYLADYLSDGALLATIASTAVSAVTVREVWTFAKERLDWLRLPTIARAIVPVLPRITGPSTENDPELDNSDRIALLLEWWAHSGDGAFAEAARLITRNPPKPFASWRDGPRLLTLIAELHDAGHHEPGPLAAELASALEAIVIELFDDGMSSDDLLKMSDIVEDGKIYSKTLLAASHTAIVKEINDVSDIVSNYTSESELNDHSSALSELASRALVSEAALRRALEAIDERIEEVQVSQAKAPDPAMPKTDIPDDEAFDDEAIISLFESLR